MLYAVTCTGKPDSLALRMANRPAHVAYLQSLGDGLVMAGPFTEPDGKTMNGSLVVIEAGSLQAAKDIAQAIPSPGSACSPRSRSAPGGTQRPRLRSW